MKINRYTTKNKTKKFNQRNHGYFESITVRKWSNCKKNPLIIARDVAGYPCVQLDEYNEKWDGCAQDHTIASCFMMQVKTNWNKMFVTEFCFKSSM